VRVVGRSSVRSCGQPPVSFRALLQDPTLSFHSSKNHNILVRRAKPPEICHKPRDEGDRPRKSNGGSGGARTRHEPNNDAAKTVSPSQVASQRRVNAGHDLSQVVTAWAKLPAALKAAILAIVRTAADSSKRTEEEP